ncbi:DNA mismatch repair protein MSH7 [Canna indica]|uniref:DNA mismatch repair protein MSH7 n=1 Tax=Canna indica TaxID=4628 RepID=A0AAQ3KJL4_9LILI|nr:DNA mismatch repair protein MSH7 [Canna indica]
MQPRQTSILSFLQKPSQENQKAGGPSPFSDALRGRLPAKHDPDSCSPGAEKTPEIRGTDTPSEKPWRQVSWAGIPAAANTDDDRRARSFSSIMHKFVKEDKSGGFRNGNQDICGAKSDPTDKSRVKKEMSSNKQSMTHNSLFREKCDGISRLSFDLDSDALGPETPAMRPRVPHFKRVQEDKSDNGKNHVSLLEGSSKRLKSVLDSVVEQKTQEKAHESTSSKFEWLNPSNIRDANGRRPSNKLYDKGTMYIPPDALKKMSATQRQYWSVKCQYMDVVLFFKVGKFYELYESDAEIGQRELDWKMTISGVGKCRQQVGISEAGIDDAVQKLTERGYKVGRMEQLETSEQAKTRGATSVIQRKLVSVSTRCTPMDGNMGPEADHLLALKEGDCSSRNGSTVYGFAFLDYAALKFWVGSICEESTSAALGALLMQVSFFLQKKFLMIFKFCVSGMMSLFLNAGSMKTQLTSTAHSADFPDASEVLKLVNSKGYFTRYSNSWSSACDSSPNRDLILCALGGLICHLSRLMLDDSLHNGELVSYHVYRNCLRMDGQTLLNLEIFSNNIDGGLPGTLYKHLDHCITASGKRLLRRWICHPLKDLTDINHRLDIVEAFIKNSEMISIISNYLRRVPDLERLLGRVKSTVGSSSTLLLPFVGERILKQRIKAFGLLVKGLRVGIDLLNVLRKEDHGILSLSMVVNLPTLSGLDELLNQFEVALDDDFPHYQDHDVKDSDAETLAVLVELFSGKATEWSQVIGALNSMDVLQSFATASTSSCKPMSRPILSASNSYSTNLDHDNGEPVLHMKGLWHPYAVSDNGNGVVPNDIYLGKDSTTCHPYALLLTGPNMGGKSTLLRATCLAVILAQLGCYVPCEVCVLSPVDTIFTRLGATDRIMSGESTFYVECSETASVLQNATKDSLVLLDELGRGTSTFDGYAIAYAVFRHLVEKVCCRLLFATHYHPLTKEFASHPRVSLQHMAYAFKPRDGMSSRESKDLIFLYKLAAGACSESYGLQVASMAGLPNPVVEAALSASQKMKLTISQNFKSSEGRSVFSTLHEEWLKTLLDVSKFGIGCLNEEDESDTLLCLWHEVKNFYKTKKIRQSFIHLHRSTTLRNLAAFLGAITKAIRPRSSGEEIRNGSAGSGKPRSSIPSPPHLPPSPLPPPQERAEEEWGETPAAAPVMREHITKVGGEAKEEWIGLMPSAAY